VTHPELFILVKLRLDAVRLAVVARSFLPGWILVYRANLSLKAVGSPPW
jgi:hypothetical protein